MLDPFSGEIGACIGLVVALAIVFASPRRAVPPDPGPQLAARNLRMDIFDRIAAAVVAIKTGNLKNPEYEAHLAAIDQHLADTDAHEAADSVDEGTRLSAIEAG